MRFGFALAALFWSAGAQAADRPVFEFRGIRAGVVVSPTKLPPCSNEAGFITKCLSPRDTVADWGAGLQYVLYLGKLSSFYVFAHPNAHAALMASFEAKYGQPCRVVDQSWQNATGARFDNPETVWCFATGELSVSKYGPTLDSMAIVYIDQNQPPKVPPKVDF